MLASMRYASESGSILHPLSSSHSNPPCEDTNLHLGSTMRLLVFLMLPVDSAANVIETIGFSLTLTGSVDVKSSAWVTNCLDRDRVPCQPHHHWRCTLMDGGPAVSQRASWEWVVGHALQHQPGRDGNRLPMHRNTPSSHVVGRVGGHSVGDHEIQQRGRGIPIQTPSHDRLP